MHQNWSVWLITTQFLIDNSSFVKLLLPPLSSLLQIISKLFFHCSFFKLLKVKWLKCSGWEAADCLVASWLSWCHHCPTSGPPPQPSRWAIRQSRLWQGGQSIQDQIEDPGDDDGAALTIVGAPRPNQLPLGHSHVCTQSHTPTSTSFSFESKVFPG